jgi:hypothetical protein
MKYIISLAIFAGTTLGALWADFLHKRGLQRHHCATPDGMAADSLFFICTGQSAVLNR